MNEGNPTVVGSELAPATASLCLRALLENAPGFVSFKDAQSRFIAVSRSKAARHGLEPGQLIGRTDAEFFSPEHAQWSLVEEESVMATGEPVHGKLTKVEWRDGREGWAQNTRLPLRNDAGEIIGTVGLTYDVTEQQNVGVALERTRRDLLDASRIAGMAEVATGVLHNVGNVLTSLNVSASVIATGLRYSKVESLQKLAGLIQEHADDLGEFITNDPKGRRVPEFIESLSQHILSERERLLNELTTLQQNIDHIKEIVTMQQSYATTAGVVESLEPATLVEDSLRMNTGTLIRHSVSVVREFHPVPNVRAEKAKVLQILVNLIRNAKYAVDDGGAADKIIVVRIAPGAPGRVQISVQDNGIGIAPQHLSRLFQHGFTTRPNGHGFGLHSALRSATDMNATLTAESAGLGMGATFTLDLPMSEPAPLSTQSSAAV